jgi:hypothetical protein
MPKTYKKYKKKYNNTRKKLYSLNGGGNRINLKKNKNKGENFEKLSFSLLAARLFIETNKTFDEISKILQDKLKTKKYEEFRKKLAGSNPDSECKKAAKIAVITKSDTECKCSGYIDETMRKDINDYFNDPTLLDMPPEHDPTETGIVTEDNPRDLPINYEKKKIGKKIGKKKYLYRYKQAGHCWLCDEPLYFYFDGEKKTGCGECEHIGSIMPSLFAGMLQRQDLSAFIYNYGLSHVHCNQNKGPKGNYTSMMFNSSNLLWEYDKKTTEIIVDQILGDKNNKDIHSNEYCPDFKKTYANWRKNDKDSKTEKKNQKTKMIKLIKNHTDIWTAKANEQLIIINNNIKKKKNLTKFVQAIEYMVERSIKNAAKKSSITNKGGNNTYTIIEHNVDMYKDTHNYHGLNVNIDNYKQIKITDIIKILEEIRKEINGNPNNDFNEFLNNFKGSVNHTRSFLEYYKIRDVNESKEMDFYEDIQNEIQPTISAFRPVSVPLDTTPSRNPTRYPRLQRNQDGAPRLTGPSNKSAYPRPAVSSRPLNYPLFIVDNPDVKKVPVRQIDPDTVKRREEDRRSEAMSSSRIDPDDPAIVKLFSDLPQRKRTTPTNDDQSRRVSPRVGAFTPIISSKGGKNKRKTRKKRN